MHIYHRLRKHLLNDPEFEPTHASGIDIIKPYPSQIKNKRKIPIQSHSQSSTSNKRSSVLEIKGTRAARMGI